MRPGSQRWAPQTHSTPLLAALAARRPRPGPFIQKGPGPPDGSHLRRGPGLLLPCPVRRGRRLPTCGGAARVCRRWVGPRRAVPGGGRVGRLCGGPGRGKVQARGNGGVWAGGRRRGRAAGSGGPSLCPARSGGLPARRLSTATHPITRPNPPPPGSHWPSAPQLRRPPPPAGPPCRVRRPARRTCTLMSPTSTWGPRWVPCLPTTGCCCFATI